MRQQSNQQLSLRSSCALARTTRLAVLSEPVVGLMVLFSLAMTLLSPLFQFQRFSEDGRLAREGALASLLLVGIPIAYLSIVRNFEREWRSGLAATLFSKPLSSTSYFLGKHLAATGVILWFTYVHSCALLLATLIAPKQILSASGEPIYAINLPALFMSIGALILALLSAACAHYYANRNFCVTFARILPLSLTIALASGWYQTGTGWGTTCTLDWRLLPAVIPIGTFLLETTTVTLLLCARFRVAPVLCLLLLWLFVALLRTPLLPPTVNQWLDMIVPSLSNCWKAEFLAGGASFRVCDWLWDSLVYVGQAGIYALIGGYLFCSGGPTRIWGEVE